MGAGGHAYAFVKQYNTARPHQSLDMAVPADRFRPAPTDPIGLRLPPSLITQPTSRKLRCRNSSQQLKAGRPRRRRASMLRWR
jgi:hypothetical protein